MDAWQVEAQKLNDAEFVREAMLAAVTAGQATLIDLCVHQFSPHGVTATATLAESHIAIHTWPELGYFAADFFFCGQGNPHKAMEVMREKFEAGSVKYTHLSRGFEESANSEQKSDDIKGEVA
jgi:S-adenosylmethionine decarboxylase